MLLRIPCPLATGLLALCLGACSKGAERSETRPAEPPPEPAAEAPAAPEVPALDERVLADLDPAVADKLRTLRAAVVAAPRDVERWRAFAGLLDVSAMSELAAQAWRVIAALDPKDAHASHDLGRNLVKEGDLEEAVAAFDQAIARDGKYPPTYWRKGLALLELGKLDEAEATFALVARAVPSDPSGDMGLARVALERDDLDGAAKLLEDLMQRFPDDGGPPKLLARVRKGQGDEDAAAALVERGEMPSQAFTIDPWAAELSKERVGLRGEIDRARAALRNGHADEAWKVLEPMLPGARGNVAVEGLAVRALMELGDTDRALEIVHASLALDDHPRMHMNEGAIRLQRGEYELALESADKALAASPGLARAQVMRALALFDLGRDAEADKALDEAFANGEKGVLARTLRGQVYKRMGRLDDALAALGEAVGAFPKSLEAWAELCDAQIQAGKLDEARTSFARVVALGGTDGLDPYLRARLASLDSGSVASGAAAPEGGG